MKVPSSLDDGDDDGTPMPLDNNNNNNNRGNTAPSSSLAPWRLQARFYFFPVDDRKLRRREDSTNFVDLSYRMDWFGALSMAVVLLNLVALALYDPTGRNQSPWLSDALTNLEYFFVAFFTFETIMRIVCLGARPVFTKAWNLLDVFVVVSSALALLLQSAFPQLTSVSGLRAIRVLRPLRAFNRIPEIRVVINSMVKSLRYLADVGALYLLFVIAMGCAGIALFSGQLLRRCVRNEYFMFDAMNTSIIQGLAASAAAQAESCSAYNAAHFMADNDTQYWWNGSSPVNLTLEHEAVLSALFKQQALSQVVLRLLDQLNDVFPQSTNTSSSAFLPIRANWEAAALVDPAFVISLLTEGSSKASFVCGAYVDAAMHRLQLAVRALLQSSASMIQVTNQSAIIPTANRRSGTSVMVDGENCTVFETASQGVSGLASSIAFSIISSVARAAGTTQATITADSARYYFAQDVNEWTGGRACDAAMTCDDGSDPLDLFFGLSCPYGYSCSSVENPAFGFMSFDHIGAAILTILTTVTTEPFPSLLYAMSNSTTKLSGGLFGIVLIVVGTLFIVNLLVALISVEFEKCRMDEAERRRQDDIVQEALRRHGGDGGGGGDDVTSDPGSGGSGGDGGATALVTASSFRSSASSTSSSTGSSRDGDKETQVGKLWRRLHAYKRSRIHRHKLVFRYLAALQRGGGGGSSGTTPPSTATRPYAASNDVGVTTPPKPASDDVEMIVLGGDHHTTWRGASECNNEDLKTPTSTDAQATPPHARPRRVSFIADAPPPALQHGSAVVLAPPALTPIIHSPPIATTEPLPNSTTLPPLRTLGPGIQSMDDITCMEQLQHTIFTRVVNTRPFFFVTSIMMIVMLVSMSIEYYGMPEDFRDALEVINMFFTVFITGEMLLRFAASDPLLFFFGGEHLMGVVVLAVSWADVASSEFNLPVIRALRLVVAVKLLRYFPTLYGHLLIMVNSFRSSLVLVCIIALELLIFACLGMQLLGGRSCFIEGDSRFLTIVEAGQLGSEAWWSTWDNFFLPTKLQVPVANGGLAVFVDYMNINGSDSWWYDNASSFLANNISSMSNNGGGVIPSLTAAVLPQASVLCAPQRLNFDSFGYAMLTSFSILASDNWNDVMYRALTTYESWVAFCLVATIFCMQYYAGVYVLLNLFIAILMSSTEKLFGDAAEGEDEAGEHLLALDLLSTDEEEEEDDDGVNGGGFLSLNKKKTSFSALPPDAKSCRSQTHGNEFPSAMNLSDFDGLMQNDGGRCSIDLAAMDASERSQGLVEATAFRSRGIHGESSEVVRDPPAQQQQQRHFRTIDQAASHVMKLQRRALIVAKAGTTRRMTIGEKRLQRVEQLEARRLEDEEKAAAAAGQLTWIRWNLLRALDHSVSNTVMILVVLTSTIALALETVTEPPDSAKHSTLSIIDDVCSGIFILEFCLRVFAKGPKQTFFGKTPWNWLELLLVVSNIVDLVLSHAFRSERNVAHIVRALYILRPLRILRRTAGIRMVARSLIGALRPLKDVIVVGVIVYVVAAIMGVQLFKGSMRSCANSPRPILTESECLAEGYSWENTGRNFDHLGQAMLSLFVVASLEQWQDVLFAVMDSVSPDVAPQVDANPGAALYVMTFAVIGGFFFVSLFVSVLIRSYEREKERMNRVSVFLTEEQEQWLLTQQSVLASMPLAHFLSVPKKERGRLSRWNRVRAVLIQISLHPVMHHVVNITVIVSMVSSAAQHYPRTEGFDVGLNTVNTAVTVVYLAEAVIKLGAVHPELYFSSAWNRFDFFVLAVSLVDLVLTYMSALESATGISRALRLFRAARLLRLAQSSKRLSRIVVQFTHSLFGLMNVAAFLVLLIASYALACMWTFGALYKDGTVITVYRNFDTFVDAGMILMQLLFGGDWTIMTACSRTESTRSDNFNLWEDNSACSNQISSCGNQVIAVLMFVTYFIIGRYVLLNIFIAVIVESFRGDERNSGSKHTGAITEGDIKAFVESWVAFDRHRRLYIATRDLLPMLQSLPSGHPFAPPEVMRPPGYDSAPRQRRRYLIHQGFSTLLFLAPLGLEERSGCIEFFDVLTALIQHVTKCDTVDALVEPAREQFERQFRFRLECRVDPAEIAMAEATAARRLEKAGGREDTTEARANKREVLVHYSASFLADVWKGCAGFRRELAERQAALAAAREASMQSRRTRSNSPPPSGSGFWSKWRRGNGNVSPQPRSPTSASAAALGATFIRPTTVPSVVAASESGGRSKDTSTSNAGQNDLDDLEELLLGPRHKQPPPLKEVSHYSSVQRERSGTTPFATARPTTLRDILSGVGRPESASQQQPALSPYVRGAGSFHSQQSSPPQRPQLFVPLVTAPAAGADQPLPSRRHPLVLSSGNRSVTIEKPTLLRREGSQPLSASPQRLHLADGVTAPLDRTSAVSHYADNAGTPLMRQEDIDALFGDDFSWTPRAGTRGLSRY